MANPTFIVFIVVGSILIGNQIHERYHYWTGKFFGGNPRYAGRFSPLFPTRTVFRDRDNLSRRDTRLVSIPGHAFFIILVILAIIPDFPSSYPELALVGVVSGGAFISWSDDMAARNPDIWLKFNDWMESEDSNS